MNPSTDRSRAESRWPLGIDRLVLRVTLAIVVLSVPRIVEACAVCWSDPDSPQSRGAALGILLLLAVTGGLLLSFAAFFVFLWRRARYAAAVAPVDQVPVAALRDSSRGGAVAESMLPSE